MLTTLIVVPVLLVLMIGVLAHRLLHDHHVHQAARLRIIEKQLAALGAALRRTAKPANRDVFSNPTTHEEPDEWRNS